MMNWCARGGVAAALGASLHGVVYSRRARMAEGNLVVVDSMNVRLPRDRESL